MPSAIDPTKPASGVPASKEDLRANLLAAKAEIEHGGFAESFTPTNYGPVGNGQVLAHLQAIDAVLGTATPGASATWVNVKEAFGAVGNNSADDYTALQNAINSQLPLYLPQGVYRISQPLIYPNAPLIIRGAYHGVTPSGPRAIIIGNFAAPLLYKSGGYLDHNNTFPVGTPDNAIQVPVIISDIFFVSEHANGCCLQIPGMDGSVISRCTFIGFRGAILTESHNVSVYNCRFEGSWDGKTIESWSQYDQAWGLMAGGQTSIYESNFTFRGGGCLLIGQRNSIFGGRFEVNGIGLQLGGTSFSSSTLGSFVPATTANITGLYFESNYKNIIVNGTANSVMSAVNVHGGTNGPTNEGNGIGLFGMAIESATASSFEQMNCGGQYKKAAIIVRGFPVFRSVGGTNAYPNRPVWAGSGALFSPRGGTQVQSLDRIEYSPSVNAGQPSDLGLVTWHPDLQVRGIKGLNIRDPNVLPNNLGGNDVAVPQGATSMAILFEGGASEAHAAITNLAAVSGGSLTAGTYEYAHTLVGRRGETGIGSVGSTAYKSVVVASGQRVNVTLAGAGGDRVRRIYRVGPNQPTGRFGGYWQIPLSQETFSDDGNTPFQGTESPPEGPYSIPSGLELDANYAVVVTPSWNTNCWVTNKATAGFTINFGTAASAGATVQWLLFRA